MATEIKSHVVDRSALWDTHAPTVHCPDAADANASGEIKWLRLSRLGQYYVAVL